MEVTSQSDDLDQDRALIRLICKRQENLFVSRSLLIRSSKHLAAILYEEHCCEERYSSTIQLDAWPREDLAAILLSIKTNDTEPIFANVNHYFTAIYYFSFTPLLQQCIEFKISNLSDESVVDDFALAERFSVVELRDKCMEYLLRRLPEVLRTSEKSRRNMTAELLLKVLRHDKLAVRNEDEVLSLIDIWCSSGKRQSERVKLLQGVRFAHLTQNAFDRCRQDAQCLEVPQFRRLLETPRWSDLNKELLLRRGSNRPHYHVVGSLNSRRGSDGAIVIEHHRTKGVVVHCSETGILSTQGSTSEAFVARNRLHYVGFGNQRFVFQHSRNIICIPFSYPIVSFSGFQHFSDFSESKPSSIVRFSKPICVAAPPVLFEKDLFIVHVPYKNEPTLFEWGLTLKSKDFGSLEILRYRDGKATSRQLQIPTKDDDYWKFRTNKPFRKNKRTISCLPVRLRMPARYDLRLNLWRSLTNKLSLNNKWTKSCLPVKSQMPTEYDLRHNLWRPLTNKLFLNDKWTILCLPLQGVLIVIDSPHPVGPIIKIPEKCWFVEDELRYKTDLLSDMVIVGTVAYVLIRSEFYKKSVHYNDRKWAFAGPGPADNVTAYDLKKGKWLPEHFFDLKNFFNEKRSKHGLFDVENFEFFLKVVRDEVFLIALSDRLESRDSGFPLAAVDYVYRLERSADGLRLCPVSDRAAASVNRPEQRIDFEWGEIPNISDGYPCEYATALQLKVSQEEDPIEREKLRRFC